MTNDPPDRVWAIQLEPGRGWQLVGSEVTMRVLAVGARRVVEYGPTGPRGLADLERQIRADRGRIIELELSLAARDPDPGERGEDRGEREADAGEDPASAEPQEPRRPGDGPPPDRPRARPRPGVDARGAFERCQRWFRAPHD